MQEIWIKQLRLLSTRIITHHYPMDKSSIFKYHNQFWFVIFASFLFWLFFLYFNSENLMSSKNEVGSLVNDYPNSVFFGMSNSVVEPISRSLPIMNSDTVQPPFNRLPDGNNREEPIIGLPIEDNKEEPIRKSSAIENRVEFVNKQVPTAGNKVQPIKEKPVDGLAITENQAKPVRQPPVMTNKIEPVKQLPTIEDKVVSDSDSCLGSYIYVHNLPKRFNYDMLKNCRSLSLWTNMCWFMTNAGLGPQLSNSERVFSNTGWFATNQFALDVIFHYRMKQYKCITNDSSMASAIFVPFYAGLDVARYLWGYNTSMRDSTSLDLVKWLRARPEWKVLGGRDHFLVAGRITWDFRRSGNENSDWGNELMVLPEVKNMSMIVIESSPWHSNDFAIPYPTYFHPSRENEVFQWQTRMRRIKRRFLFSFAGAPRPNLTDSIRNQIIDQCRSASRRKCKLLDCDSGGNKCHNPNSVMKMFQSSVFCLQPSGDSFTRRSAFDSFLAGCIPVFFHPGSAYVQYTWHVPRNYKKYSVFIPENEVREGKVNIERRLLRIPKEKVRAMRLEVIKLIPRLIYADPRGRLETLEDAFDLAVKGVLKRVDRVRKEIIDGDSSDVGYTEENSWKYSLLGTVEEHEWEPFFYRPRKIN